MKGWVTGAICALAMCGGAVPVAAQGWSGGLWYGVAQPKGDTEAFTDEFSWRGAGLDLRRWVADDVTVGMSLGWNVFNSVEDGVVQAPERDATVSGTQFRTVNSFPLMLSAHLYRGDAKSIQPYIGLNVGTYYYKTRVDLGLLRVEEDTWHLGFAPEAGLLLPAGPGTDALFTVRYNYGLESSGRALAYWQFAVGLFMSM